MSWIWHWRKFPNRLAKLAEKLGVGLVGMWVVVLGLVGCGRLSWGEGTMSEVEGLEGDQVKLEDVLEGERLLAVVQDSQVIVVDPDFASAVEAYRLKPDEIPNNFELFQFMLSPSHRYLVWYTAKLGVLKLNFETKQVDVLRTASDWLNQNPFIQMDKTQDVVYLIDNRGTELIEIELEGNQAVTHEIPYPFGNEFHIAPNGDTVIYISGFGQTSRYPEYLITSLSGEEPVRFSTRTRLNKRGLVAWLPDSSAVVLPEDQHRLVRVEAINPEERRLLYEFAEGISIEQVQAVGSDMFVETTDGVWQVIDLESGELVARTTPEIAKEIHRPRFYPWYELNFLIEETIRLEPEEFKRLWLSNFMGVKKKILDRFYEVTLEVETPTI